MTIINFNKLFASVDSIATFNTLKIATDDTNTDYIVGGGEVQEGNGENAGLSFGTPQIKWEQIVFIEDIGAIWNRGKFYSTSSFTSKTGEQFTVNDLEERVVTLENTLDGVNELLENILNKK